MKNLNKYFYSLLFIFAVFCAKASASSNNYLTDLASKIATSDYFMNYVNERANIVFSEMAINVLATDKRIDLSKETEKFNNLRKSSFDKSVDQYKQLQLQFPELLNLTENQISETLKMAFETEHITLFFNAKLSCIGKKTVRFLACSGFSFGTVGLICVGVCFSASIAATVIGWIAQPFLIVGAITEVQIEAIGCAQVVRIGLGLATLTTVLGNCGTQYSTDIYDCIAG
jgi:hypothetical protein